MTAINYMREYLLVSNDKRLVLYDLVQKKPLKYILDVVNPSKFACNTIYDSFTYAYSADNKGNNDNIKIIIFFTKMLSKIPLLLNRYYDRNQCMV